MSTRPSSILSFGFLMLAGVALAAPTTGCYVDFGGGAGDDDAAATDAAVSDAAPQDAAPPSDAIVPVDVAQPDAFIPPDAGPDCGDGNLDPGEECDEGANNSDTLANQCRTNCILPWCGDGVTDTGEQCDDGPGNSNVSPNSCRLDCTNPRCGDGVTDSGEQCDDGNTSNTDSCLSTCLSAFCGDNIIWAGVEDCDDGGTVAGDGCSATCADENLPELTYISSTAGGWSTPWVMTFAGEPHAPTSTIRAAVSLEDVGRAMLFTQTTYHVLEIPSLNWYDSGTLAADFPQLPGSSLRAGNGLGAAQHTNLTLVAGTMAYLYDYDHITGAISYQADNNLLTNDDWTTPEAPDPTQLTCLWLDEFNDNGWVNDSLWTACGISTGSVVFYGIGMTASSLHVQEIGNCFDFYDQMSINAFPPFGNSVAGRPTFTDIRGAFYFEGSNRLYVVTQQ